MGFSNSVTFQAFHDQDLFGTLSSSSIEGCRLDYQPLFGKGARAPPSERDRTRESGGNRAYEGCEYSQAHFID